ncbi:MAG: hypothetical protein AYK19_02540 [Theionarchaea archaeon DG-70-1]|nr:MAG: hypothetical protein AYK19_02540 [Theionarchaea archaeon DG-70-1]
MDRKVPLAVISVALALLAVTAATAHPSVTRTPLYIFRMEQQSSEMNFLPTERNTFIYTTAQGHTVLYEITGCGYAAPLATGGGNTCNSCSRTCSNTCPVTCMSTCPETCVYTCHTCVSTCPYTCVNTCSFTCGSTCPNTCWSTCDEPCP